PIRARRTPWRERAWRWCRRNPAVASLLTALAALLLVIAGSVGWVASDRAARAEALDRQGDTILGEAVALLEKARWPEALAAMDRADKLLAAAGRGARPARLGELRKDLDMARRLEDLYSQRETPLNIEPLPDQDAAYARAFRDYGIDLAE